MIIHHLKILPEFFEDTLYGLKTFEVRINDRPYSVGDILCLNEYYPGSGYSGRVIEREITYILDDNRFIKEGYIIMSTKECLQK